ncbi:PAS domain S-box protein [Niabella ginsengisoli]|uniref:histidine kinase n=1 Tax=Niabella ginsengisoli TaxID=522298 RepID=A0ABS9SKH4_9BACT|nr:PAS domain S-box protein [Niabella ginsengisoli]MCH5598847.1 PAS domain S-box protein [Niabella ginsengisoli]
MRANEARQTYLVKLDDAVRRLAAPAGIEESVTRVAMEHFDADRCYYCEIEAGKAVIRHDARREGLPSVAGVYDLERFPLHKTIVEKGRTFIVPNVREADSIDEDLRQLCESLQLISFLNVPVIKDGQPAGQLCIVQSMPRDWADIEVSLAEETAERIWAAVERSRTQKALFQSEEKYRTLFNSIDEAVTTLEIIFDENDKVVDWLMIESNQAMTKVTGWSDEIVGKKASEYLGDVEAAWTEAVEHVVKTGEPIRVEHPVAGLNGNWFEVYLALVGGKGSRQVVCVYNNITERKRREENLAFLAEISQDLVEMSKPEDTLEVVGAKIGTHFNIARSMFVEIHENEEKAMVRDWHRTDLTGIHGEVLLSQFIDERYLKKCRAGETIIITDVHHSPLVDGPQVEKIFGVTSFINIPIVKEGKWVFTMGIYDVLPRKWHNEEIELLEELTARIWTRLERAHAEEALRRSEENYRVIVNQSIAGILKMDVQGRVIFSNERFCEMLGYDCPTLLQMDINDIVYEKDQERNTDAFMQLVSAGKAYEIEKRLLHKDGSIIWVNNQVSPIFNNMGNVEGVAIISIDINHQKELEQQKDEFIGVASHELKTPLTSIRAYGEILEEVLLGSGNPRYIALMSKMNGQINRLIKLIYALLDTTRVSGGQLILQKERFDLNTLVEEHVQQARLISANHNILIHVETLTELYADKERIGQVLDNLLSNAIKYSPDGGNIVVNVEEKESTVQVSVQDSGLGIPPKAQEKIFDRFFRVKVPTTKIISGIGLGLYISREIIEKHDGSMSVISVEGKGSIFYFELPTAEKNQNL